MNPDNRLSANPPFRKSLLTGVSLLLLLSTFGCQQPNKVTESPESPSNSPADLESRLLLNNATLEQSNSQGQNLWKIQVQKATYSKDRNIAQLEKIKGNIYQDGKLVLYISADKGEIYKGGEEIFLKENIVATDPRNGAVIRSQEVEWHPKDSVLIVRKQLQGNHAQLDATAKEGRYYTDKQQVELIGDIIATAKEPRLQLKAEKLAWKIPEQKVFSERPLKIIRYQDKTITDQVVADKGEVDIKAKTATIRDNIEYKSIEPALQIASNHISWNYKDRWVISEQPVRIIDHKEKLNITGNRARVDLNKKLAHLYDGVEGVNFGTQAKLYSQNLVWNMPAKMVEANGNVIYEQPSPKFNATGDQAVGSLQNNNIVVTSRSQERVVTEIFPE